MNAEGGPKGEYQDDTSSGRIYDSRLGRFLQADPNIDGVTNTQGYNRYSYLHNNPLNATDPTGFFSATQIFKGIAKNFGLVIGAVATVYCAGGHGHWYT